jgi:hypothetical protein
MMSPETSASCGRCMLHDDHDRGLFIVEASRHGFADEPDRLLALSVALGL